MSTFFFRMALFSRLARGAWKWSHAVITWFQTAPQVNTRSIAQRCFAPPSGQGTPSVPRHVVLLDETQRGSTSSLPRSAARPAALTLILVEEELANKAVPAAVGDLAGGKLPAIVEVREAGGGEVSVVRTHVTATALPRIVQNLVTEGDWPRAAESHAPMSE